MEAILLLLGFLVLLYLLIETVMRGRRVAREAHDHLSGHRRWATAATIVAVVLVIVTDVFVRTHGGVNPTPLFWIHFSFAVPFFILLLTLRLKVTGLKYPRLHRVLAYSCCVAFVGALSTGAPLLFFKTIFS